VVLAALPQATISAVNRSEVVAKLAKRGMPEEAIRAALDGPIPEVTLLR
jgi:PIN domain nuclease of toxin-antitoxin system